MNKELAIKKFEEIRDIPYRIPLSKDEVDHCCIGKHILLYNELSKLGYSCRYRTCTFSWADFGLPENILEIPHEDACTHLYLEVKDGKWKTLDCTWDKALTNILPVNDWDGVSHKKIVLPQEKICSLLESEQFMSSVYDDAVVEDDMAKSGQFYKALNDWLASQRV